MSSTLLLVCVWLSGLLSGALLGALDAKGSHAARNIAGVVLAPLVVAFLLAITLSVFLKLAPLINVDRVAEFVAGFLRE